MSESAADIAASPALDTSDPLRPVEVDELARALGLAPKTVYALAARGLIPGELGLGRRVRFARAAVVAWLREGQPAPRRKARSR